MRARFCQNNGVAFAPTQTTFAGKKRILQLRQLFLAFLKAALFAGALTAVCLLIERGAMKPRFRGGGEKREATSRAVKMKNALLKRA